MKLLVTQHVNKRIGKPGTTAQVAGFLSPNDTLEVEDVVYGEVVDGNYLWYRCKDGFYYWSGAFFNINFQLGDCTLGRFSLEQQMDILQMLVAEAAAILKEEVQDYVGCGVGNKNFDELRVLSLLVYVKEKIDDADLNVKVLSEISYRGIKILTDVLGVGTFSHSAVISKRNLENDIPSPIGGGIRPQDKSRTGTRSLYVTRKKDKTEIIENFLLTCYHVLLDDLFPVRSYEGKWRRASFPIVSGQSTGDIYTVAKGEYSGNYDYAAVAISSTDIAENKVGDIVISEHVPFTELAALKGATVRAVGFVSGLTEGKVLSVTNNVVVGDHGQSFNHVLLTEKISEPGDSGAPVVDKKSKRLIGFIIGGNEEKSVVLPFYNLFLNRGFKIKS